MIQTLLSVNETIKCRLQGIEGVVPLAIRLFLAPVFWTSGMNKLNSFDATVYWFKHTLDLPFPFLMAMLATATELIGAVLLLLGSFTRWISVPLMVVMLVAIFMVHWPNGWQAIADPLSPFASSNISDTMDKLHAANQLLQEHGHYDWLTSSGSFAIINNGIEFAVIYLILLMSLVRLGGGQYVSIDHFLFKWLKK